jgi:hypothetical protein
MRWTLRSVAFLAITVNLAACSGDNLFSGDSPDLLPEVVGLSAGSTATAGQAVSIRVDAAATHGVAQIYVSLQGAATRDTIVEILPPRAQVSQTVRFTMPAVITDTLLTVRATAIDRFGNESRSRTVDVVAFGGPEITAVNRPSTVRAGEVLNVEVGVLGARRVTRVTYQIRGALSKDTTIVVNPPQNSVNQSLLLQVPTAVQDTVVRMMVFARDESGADGPQRNDQILLAIDPPSVAITVPATARAGDRMDVAVVASALRKLSRILIQLRGANVSKDTTILVTPERTDFSQTISIPLPGDIRPSVQGAQSTALTVQAFATDKGGAISQTQPSSVDVPTTPPVIMELVLLPAGATGVFDNAPADFRVTAEGSRPLTRIDLVYRGAINTTQPFTVPSGSIVYSFTVPFATILVPNNPSQQMFTVTAIATDAAGGVSEYPPLAIPITVDTTASAQLGTASSRSKSEPSLSTTFSRLKALLTRRENEQKK